VPVRSAVLAPLAHWISEHWVDDGPLRLLDVGCGDLLLARLLPGSCRLDGYDTSGEARAAARRTLADLGRDRGTVHDVRDQVPTGSFDGVILSSMLQYLPDRAAVGDLLGDVARWLRPDGFGVIATDVVDRGAGRLADGRDLLAFLVAQQGPVRGAVTAVRAARRSPRGLLALDDQDMAVQAARAGLTTRRLAANLSPLRHRASYLLTRVTSPG
jgi:SAM-dependent methyltransferase